MRALLLMAALVACGAVPASAQRDSTGPQLAAELLAVTGLRESVHQSDSSYVAHAVALDPRWLPYKDILAQWADEVYDWSRLRPLLVQRLVKAFTAAELRDVLQFYRTPVGQKWVRVRPLLQRDVTDLMFAAEQRYRPELHQRVLARAAQLHRATPRLD